MAFDNRDSQEQYSLVVFYRLVNAHAENLEVLGRSMFMPENIAMIALLHQRQCRDCQDLMAHHQLPANEPDQEDLPEVSEEDQAWVEGQIARYNEERLIEEMAGPDHIFTHIETVEYNCGKLRISLRQCEQFLRHLKDCIPGS